MGLDAYGRYTANHKPWDHVGNIVPDVEHSEGIRPAGHFKPAAWLPVQFWEKYYENWVTIMPGKIVAFDNQGRVCPAQYGLAGATITYTQNDVDAGVIDVRTGVTLLVAAIGTFNVAAVTSFMGSSALGAMAVSAPVGVVSYPVLQWAGDASTADDGWNPNGLLQHNYSMQNQIALLCDYVLQLPKVPAVTSSAALTQASRTGNVSTLTALGNLPVAVNTIRTPLTFASSAGATNAAAVRFAVQKTTAALVAALGDWHIDYTSGVITVYAVEDILAGWYTLTYSNYASAPTGANVSRFACVVDNVQPGDFVICNADSNFALATPSVNGDLACSDGLVEILGQVLEVENVLGKDSLDKVRTAYPNLATSATGSFPAYAGQMDQMPGSANGGVPSNVHYAGAANYVATINLMTR